MLKKNICLAIALLLVLTVIPAGAAAAMETVEPLSAVKRLTDGIDLPAAGGGIDGRNGWRVTGSGITAALSADPANGGNQALKLERTRLSETQTDLSHAVVPGWYVRGAVDFENAAAYAGQSVDGKLGWTEAKQTNDYQKATFEKFATGTAPDNMAMKLERSNATSYYPEPAIYQLSDGSIPLAVSGKVYVEADLYMPKGDNFKPQVELLDSTGAKTASLYIGQGTLGVRVYNSSANGYKWYANGSGSTIFVNDSWASGWFRLGLLVDTVTKGLTIYINDVAVANGSGLADGWINGIDVSQISFDMEPWTENAYCYVDNLKVLTEQGPAAADSMAYRSLMSGAEYAKLDGKQKVSMRVNAAAAQSSVLEVKLHSTPADAGLGEALSHIRLSGGMVTNVSDAATEQMRGYYDAYTNNGTYLGAYPEDRWFELGLLVDTATGNFDLYVDSKQINVRPLGGYRTAAQDLSQISFGISPYSATVGGWYIDDLNTASYNAANVDASLSGSAWTALYSEDMAGLTQAGGAAIASGVQAVNWRRDGISYWTGAVCASTPATSYMSARFRGEAADGYLSLERSSTIGSGYADWPYYNFKPAWNSLDSLGGKMLASFTIRSTSHSSADERPRYFGLADKDGNDVLRLWVKKANLYWSDVANKWIGSISGGRNVSILVDYAGKTCSVYLDGTLISDEIPFTNQSAGAPAKLFFGLEPTVAATGDTTTIDNIVIKQWNEYGIADVWNGGFSDDLEWNTSEGTTINGTNSWTANEHAVWASENGDGLVRLNAGAEAVKKLEEWAGGPVVTLSGLAVGTIDLKTDGTGTQGFSLRNDEGAELAAASVEAGKIRAGGAELGTADSGEWFKLTIALNTESGKYWVYKNGEQLNAEGVAGTAGAVTQLGFSGVSGTGYVNNLFTGTAESAVYTVRDVVMTNSSGEFVNKPEAGGAVTKLKVAQGQDSSGAVAVVAVYKDMELVGTELVEIAGTYDVGSLTTYPLHMTLPGAAGEYRLKVMLWNSISEMQPLAVTPYETGKDKVTMYVAGDSIAQTYSWYYHYPMTGYGQTLENYLNTDYVAVSNYAQSGTSTKTFADQGRLDEILKSGRSGDYLTIQFGHNDQGQNIGLDIYKANLKEYIDAARAKGINPLLITPPVRRMFTQENKVDETNLGGYPAAMREVASAEGVPLIDLNARSVSLMNVAGVEGTKLIYMHVKPNDERYFKTADGAEHYSASQYNKASATEDNTHFSVYGANLLAQIISEELQDLDGWTVSGYAVPDKTDPEQFRVAAE